MSTDPYGSWDGAYVLGSLSPAERAEYERHLSSCDACAAAVAEIAGMPGLLKAVPLDQVQAGPEDAGSAQRASIPPMPTTLLPRLRREVRRAERRRVGALAGAAAGAAVVLTVGVVGASGGLHRQSAGAEPTPTTTVTSTSTSTGRPSGSSTSTPAPSASLRMQPLGQAAVSASLAVTPVHWGTEVSIICLYRAKTAAPSYAYTLVVRDKAGHIQQVGAWLAKPGQQTRLTGASSWPRARIAAIEVRTSTGTPILRLSGSSLGPQ